VNTFRNRLRVESVPASATVKANCTGVVLNVAGTAFAALLVTEQLPVPEQAPLQPANVEPGLAIYNCHRSLPLATATNRADIKLNRGGDTGVSVVIATVCCR
jgi:hypothetical protein